MSAILIRQIVMVLVLILTIVALIKLVKDNNIFTMTDEDDESEMEILKEEECKDTAA